jgi:hypothetical protein
MTEKWQLRGWHGQTGLAVVVPVVREGTLKLRWGVPPRVRNLLCHNLVVHHGRGGSRFAAGVALPVLSVLSVLFVLSLL